MGRYLVRPGEHRDIDAIAAMSHTFWQNTVYDEPCCPETVSRMAAHCIDSDMMAVLEVGGVVVGFACGIVGPLLGNADVLTGTEIAWWVNPEHRSGRNGIALLKRLEGMAKAQGVRYWNMVYMESSMPEEVRSLYEKLGYRKVETTYMREL